MNRFNNNIVDYIYDLFNKIGYTDFETQDAILQTMLKESSEKIKKLIFSKGNVNYNDLILELINSINSLFYYYKTVINNYKDKYENLLEVNKTQDEIIKLMFKVITNSIWL